MVISRVGRLLSLLLVAKYVFVVSLVNRSPQETSEDETITDVIEGSPPSDIPSVPPPLQPTVMTDLDTIFATIRQVNQRTGAQDSAPPSAAAPPTIITAMDGDITVAGQSGDSLLEVLHNPTAEEAELVASDSPNAGVQERRREEKRYIPDFYRVFDGTGTGENDRDAAVQGTAYLTYVVVSNSTYNVDACLLQCNTVPGCVYVNLYYEYNNAILDQLGSNLKCAMFGDIHQAAAKIYWGGQQSYPAPAETTYIKHSSAYALQQGFLTPNRPYTYDLIFGPTNGANNAPGYMGFALLSAYDTDACANLCNGRAADPVGGVCKYFNIWRAVVNGFPTSYVCSMYTDWTTNNTATNYGQGDLQVTFSRGYRKSSFLPDGGFELWGWTCPNYCVTQLTNHWRAYDSAGGTQDAVIMYWQQWARTFNALAVLGSLNNVDSLPGTIETRNPLPTYSHWWYKVAFYHRSDRSSPENQANSRVDVLWNGEVVLEIRPGYQGWTHYEVRVFGRGGDKLAFRGGQAPAWSFIDDVGIWVL
ncbi:hypothetical protein AX16_003539 [Volvariella volvacea WC 439]|nr:hypothetical protein AX16_003539 [Volvariella volvacea WC 439]